MHQQVPAWLGITSLLVVAGLAAFPIFGLRQGAKVRKPPQGVPPENTSGYSL